MKERTVKNIITAATIALASIAGAASGQEMTGSWRLHEKGDWAVDFSSFDDGDAMCTASYTGSLSAVGIHTFRSTPGVFMGFELSSLFGNATRQQMLGAVLQVDRREGWGVSGEVSNGVYFVNLPKPQGLGLLEELAAGRSLFLVDPPSGDILMDYSLDGSYAALIALGDCTDKL